MQALIVWDLNGVLPKRKVSLQEDCAAAEIVRRTTIQILSELVRHGVAPQDLQFEAASKYSTLPELLDQSLQQFDYNRLLSCSSDNHFQGLASRLQDSPIETVVICGTKQPQKYIQQLGNIGKRVWVVGEEQVFSKKAQRFVDQAMPLVNKKELNFPENLPRHKVKEWVSVLWDLENTVFLETDPSQSSITDVQVQARALHQYLKEQGFAIASRWSKASVKHHSYALQQLTFALAPFGIRVEEARHFGEAAEKQLTRLTEKISKH